MLSVILFSTSCSHIARLCSTPTYSVQNGDKISLSNFNKNSVVYIQETNDDEYKLSKKVMEDAKKKLIDNGINITRDERIATHILSLNIKNIAVDIDFDTANTIKNSIITAGVAPSYIFDNGNSPHINSDFNQKGSNSQNYKNRRRILPSVVFTSAGAAVGFVGGFLLSGSLSPMLIGFGGAVLLGGTTYFLYETFRNVGIIVSYEISIKEKINHQIKHSIKALSKKSQNIADEVFYDYHDNWSENISKSSIVAIGSRALKEYMILQMVPIISSSISRHFPSDK